MRARSSGGRPTPAPACSLEGEDLALDRALARFADGQATGVLVIGEPSASRSAVLQRIDRRLRRRGLRSVQAGPDRPLSVYELAIAATRSDGATDAVVVDDLRACDAATRQASTLRLALSGSRAGVVWVVACSPGEEPAWDAASTQVIRAPGDDSEDGAPGLEAFSRAEVRILAAAAAVGPAFTPRELQQVLGEPIGALLQPLALAVDTGVLRDEGRELAFATPAMWGQLRDVLGHEAAVVGATALRMHLQARAVDRLCARWPVVADVDDATVVAAARLVARRDPLAAADHLAARFGEAYPRDDVSAAQALVTAYRLHGGDPETAAGAAAELANRRPPDHAFVLSELFFASDTRAVLDLARRTLGEGSLDDVARGRLAAIVLVCRAYAGEFDADEVDRVSAQATRSEDARATALVHLARTLYFAADGDLLGALRCAALGSEQVAEDSIGPEWWIAAVFRAKLLADLGRLQQAEEVIDAFAVRAERCGQLLALPALIMVRATCAIERGDLDGATVLLRTARRLAAAIGRPQLIEANSVSLLVRIAHAQGSYESLEDLRGALAEAGDLEVRRETVEIALAFAADGLNDVDEDTGRVIPVVSSGAWTHSSAMRYALARGITDEVVRLRVLLRQGHVDEALQVSALIDLVATRADASLPRAAADHARGLVDRSAERLLRAWAVYEELGRPILEAQVLEDLGELESSRERRVDALRRARERWLSAGANREVARVDRLLRSAGVQPTPADDAGPRLEARLPGLSPAEDRVVRELLSGASNAEIAERLFLSKYTVAAHLRRIYARLGVRSRRELVVLAESDAERSTRRQGAGAAGTGSNDSAGTA